MIKGQKVSTLLQILEGIRQFQENINFDDSLFNPVLLMHSDIFTDLKKEVIGSGILSKDFNGSGPPKLIGISILQSPTMINDDGSPLFEVGPTLNHGGYDKLMEE